MGRYETIASGGQVDRESMAHPAVLSCLKKLELLAGFDPQWWVMISILQQLLVFTQFPISINSGTLSFCGLGLQVVFSITQQSLQGKRFDSYVYWVAWNWPRSCPSACPRVYSRCSLILCLPLPMGVWRPPACCIMRGCQVKSSMVK